MRESSFNSFICELSNFNMLNKQKIVHREVDIETYSLGASYNLRYVFTVRLRMIYQTHWIFKNTLKHTWVEFIYIIIYNEPWNA